MKAFATLGQLRFCRMPGMWVNQCFSSDVNKPHIVLPSFVLYAP